MRYRYLLVDNDNTLMDFNASEGYALTAALSACGLPHDAAVCARYHQINRALWEALERGETTQAILKVERFARLLDTLPDSVVSAEALAGRFQEALSQRADLIPGALAFLTLLRGRMKIALVTNGVSAIQRGRLSRCPFTPLLDAVVISEEIGVSKPDPRFVDAALAALHCEDKAAAVLLGDSVTADIAAATAAGIDSIWFAPGGGSCPAATYTVRSLEEAGTLLMKGESHVSDCEKARTE